MEMTFYWGQYPFFVPVIAFVISWKARQSNTTFKPYAYQWIATSVIPPVLLLVWFMVNGALNFHGICPLVTSIGVEGPMRLKPCSFSTYILLNVLLGLYFAWLPIIIAFGLTQVSFIGNWLLKSPPQRERKGAGEHE